MYCVYLQYSPGSSSCRYFLMKMGIVFIYLAFVLLHIISSEITEGICIHKWRNGRLVSEGDCEEPNAEEIISHLRKRVEAANTEENQVKTTSCGEAQSKDAKIWNETGGVFDIYPEFNKIEVYCDLTTECGGWLVFQRRMNGQVNFYRVWNEYVNGFGDSAGEHWLGLDILHNLTSSRNYELRIDMADWDGNKRYAKYSNFRVGNAQSSYTLSVSGYSGNAGDSFTEHNGFKFSTKDRDFDTDESRNCAVTYRGAWWYDECHRSNLNGHYFVGGHHDSYGDGVE
ncbi:microfibril-associated glycoprotein 4-like [Styela clava]